MCVCWLVLQWCIGVAWQQWGWRNVENGRIQSFLKRFRSPARSSIALLRDLVQLRLCINSGSKPLFAERVESTPDFSRTSCSWQVFHCPKSACALMYYIVLHNIAKLCPALGLVGFGVERHLELASRPSLTRHHWKLLGLRQLRGHVLVGWLRWAQHVLRITKHLHVSNPFKGWSTNLWF